MPECRKITASEHFDHDQTTFQARDVPQTAPAPPTDWSRQADAVAKGLVPFPRTLCSEEAERLAAEVARRRRAQLVKFIAHMIALDIYRDRAKNQRSEQDDHPRI